MALKSEWSAKQLLPAVYGIFAVSATFRAAYTLIRRYEEAPFAYWLSLIAAITYIFATVALASKKPTWRRAAKPILFFELFGVLTVGTLSLTAPELFQHPTVWSSYGLGYGFIPIALPILGLLAVFRGRV
jgi:hypothetical protein